MTSTGRVTILGFAMVGVLAATADIANAQATGGGARPSIVSGVRFDAAPATVRDWTPTLDLVATGVRMSDAAVQASTQNRAEGIGFGVEAGIQRNTLSGEGESDSGTGTMFGVWVGGNKGGRVGFTGEFLYVIRKITEGNDEFKYNALEIPAVFHVNFGRGGPNDALGYALVGPVFSINLKQELNGIDVSEDFNGADIGVMVGGGVEFFRLAFEVRYNIGLRNISSEGEIGDLKSRQLEFVVKFRLTGA